MKCKSCGSVNLREFIAEMAIHSPGIKSIDQRIVWVFPQLTVCLNCGMTEFVVSEAELQLLAKGDAAAAG